jgi:hypothetical protein
LNDATKKEFLKKEIELAEKAGFSQLEGIDRNDILLN